MYIITMPSKSKTSRKTRCRQCGGYVYSKSRSTKSNLKSKSKSQYKNRSNKLKNKTK